MPIIGLQKLLLNVLLNQCNHNVIQLRNDILTKGILFLLFAIKKNLKHVNDLSLPSVT